jgi:hypothetical protein
MSISEIWLEHYDLLLVKFDLNEILRGVYPELKAEILHFVQNDRRRTQNDGMGL